MRNHSHIRPRSPDIPHMHASFLQHNLVPSATSDGNAPSERENSVISANRKGSIKQTNTSQVLVSETVPDRRVQPSRRGKMTRFGDNPVTSTVPIPPRRQPGRDTSTRNRREFKLNMSDPNLLIPIKQTQVITTRHSDLRELQPSSSDSQPASWQPVSETTTSESSVSLPCSPSSTESTSTSGTDSSSSETSSESSSQPSSNASSPETSSSASTSLSTSPELLEMERSFNSLLVGTRDRQGHPLMRSQMDNLRDQQQRITILNELPASRRTNHGPSQCLQLQTCHFPVSPKMSK